jgi:hypothetical protein
MVSRARQTIGPPPSPLPCCLPTPSPPRPLYRRDRAGPRGWATRGPGVSIKRAWDIYILPNNNDCTGACAATVLLRLAVIRLALVAGNLTVRWTCAICCNPGCNRDAALGGWEPRTLSEGETGPRPEAPADAQPFPHGRHGKRLAATGKGVEARTWAGRTPGPWPPPTSARFK